MRKVAILLCAFFAVLLTSSCGDYAKARQEAYDVVIESTLPQTQAGKSSLDDIADDVYLQQLALCDIYVEVYEKMDIKLFEQKYPKIAKNKLMSLLSDVRQDMYNKYDKVYVENMTTLMTDVIDCPNQTAYVIDKRDEVSAFFYDYRCFNNAYASEHKSLCDILLKYDDLDNELAKRFISENSEKFSEAAVLTVEENAQENSDIRSYISRNNEITDTVNKFFGGFSAAQAKRVNTANKNLVAKLTGTSDTVVEER